MKASAEHKSISPKDIVFTENPELDRILGGSVLFPERNEVAKEQIRKYGLPKDITISKLSQH